MGHFKLNLVLAMCILATVTMSGQQLEPNLKWGKPTEAELKMTSYAQDPDAQAVILCKTTEMRYDAIDGHFRVNRVVHCRIKVLTEEGKDWANGSFSYEYNDRRTGQCEELMKLKATSYNLVNGQVVKTKMTNDMITHEDITKRQRLTKFTVPQVTVGTVLEYEYEIVSDFIGNIETWNAQAKIPVYYTMYDIVIPEYLKFNVDETGMYPIEHKVETANLSIAVGSGQILHCSGQHYMFIGHEMPALRPTKMLYAPSAYGQRVTMELSALELPGSNYKSYSNSWEDIDRRLMDDEYFGGRLGKNPLKAEMQAAGISDLANPEDRVMATFRLLKEHVKWNRSYGLYAASASKVLKERTGNNASINFMLINMLNDIGIEAVPVVLRARDRGFLTVTRASREQLSTMVVAIKLGDNMAYLDGSVEDGYLNVLPEQLLVDRARLVTKGKGEKWVNLTGLSAAKSQYLITAQLQPDGSLEGDVQSRLTGSDAADERNSFRMANDSATYIANLAQKIGCEIASCELSNHKGLGRNMGCTMHISRQFSSAGDMIYLEPLIINTLSENPLTDEKRLLPVEFPSLSNDNVTSQITLPDGYVVEELPPALKIKTEDGGLSCTIVTTENNGVLLTNMQFVVNKIFFNPSEYDTIKGFFAEAIKRANDVIVIKKAQ